MHDPPRGSTPTGNVDERVVEAARTVIAAQTGTSTGTRSRVVDRIRDSLDELHGPGTVELPSRTTLYRLLDTLSKGRHTFGSATTRRSTALKPAGVYTATTAARPGEQVQMDSTVAVHWLDPHIIPIVRSRKSVTAAVKASLLSPATM